MSEREVSESPPRPRPGASKAQPATRGDGEVAASFEDATRRLGAIVDELEGGDLPLERSLELFEEGVRLARSAQERLDKAERRVEELLAVDAKGAAITRDFEG